ncbi:MAG: D-Ala-D-Ala carboxypeptidase family metallohydrolase [Mycobacterium leprae]
MSKRRTALLAILLALLLTVPAGPHTTAMGLEITSVQVVPSEHTASIAWQTDLPADSWVDFGTTTAYGSVAGQNDSVNYHLVQLPGLSPNTTYYYQIRSRPAGGTVRLWTGSFTTYGSAPLTPSGVQVIIGESVVTITWNTNRPANSWVDAGLGSAYSITVGWNDSVTTHAVQLTGLQPGSVYYYRLRSQAADGAVTTRLGAFITQGGSGLPCGMGPCPPGFSETLLVGLPVQGQISTAGQEVTYTLRPVTSGTYTINSSGRTDVVGTLYNEQMQRLTGDDDSAGNQQFWLTAELEAGCLYYLTVRGGQPGVTGAYTVTVWGPKESQPLGLAVTDNVVTADWLRLNWNGLPGAHHYEIRAQRSPDVQTLSSFSLATVTATALSWQMDPSIGYRYFRVYAYSVDGKQLGASNVVGVAKYPSGLVLRLQPDSLLTASYPAPPEGPNAALYAPPAWFIAASEQVRGSLCAASIRCGELIDDQATMAVIDPLMVEHLQSVAEQIGKLPIATGYRTPERNRALGGTLYDRHIYGDAVDLRTAPDSPYSWNDFTSHFLLVGLNTMGSHAQPANRWHCEWAKETASRHYSNSDGP